MASQQRILIVDDDSMLAEALADVVREEGYEARTAVDSAGALSAVRHEPVALALVDLRLGEESEQQVIERALAANDGNSKAAARELGIARGTLYRKSRRYGITGTSG